ncbi:MAG: protein phosphatase 2C domain-containing protein [Paenisporosarcina sp.]
MIEHYSWVGNQKNFVDELTIVEVKPIIIGHFGGCSSAGQMKNEDGCLVFVNEKEDWEFTILLDAHNSAESAELVVNRFSREEEPIRQLMGNSLAETFSLIEEHILSVLQSRTFKSECRSLTGETAALFVVRKGKYLWWLSVGDCLLFFLHPELETLGEIQLNQRSFFEWIGQVNTFDLPVPCFSRGVRELRKGTNHIFATTDGLVECPNAPFENPNEIFSRFEGVSNKAGVTGLLKNIQDNNVRDSTTILSWKVNIEEAAMNPSDI